MDSAEKICYDEATQQMILKKSQALPVRQDVTISSEAQEILSWDSKESVAITVGDISDAMDDAVMSFKFENYHSAMFYADTEIKKIISGIATPNKLQKEINTYFVVHLAGQETEGQDTFY